MVGALLVTGCQPAVLPSPTETSGSPSPSASPAVDMTQPGAAQAMVRRLVAASGSSRVIMVEVRHYAASVSVLDASGKPVTWAYRDGRVQQVASDLAYVDQATFDPAKYDLSDVGALFRAAAAVSGSDQQQELQIVDRQIIDHSPSEILMAVSTMPETRTVFFYPDGTLLPTLDFRTEWGISRGLSDAIGSHTSAVQVGVGTETGAYIDFPGPNQTTARRQRTPKFPVTISQRNEQPSNAAFDPRLVRSEVVWRTLTNTASGSVPYSDSWSVVADDRARLGTPRLYFTVGTQRFVTDLAGNRVQ